MRRPTRGDAVAYGLGAVLAVVYAAISLTRYRRFDTPSWDNAIFEQAIRGYASLGAPIVDIKGPGYNILGDHFSPITALVAPLYAVFPDGATLLVAQALLVAASAVVVTRLAIEHLGRVAGPFVGVAYGLSFGVQAAVLVDFHEVAFAAPMLALAGSAYVRRQWVRVAAWTLPLLLVKEDLGVTVVAVGVVLVLSGARRVGAGVAVAGAVGFVLVLLVLIPAMNPQGTYDYLGVVGAGGGVDAGPGPLTVLFTDVGTKVVTVLVTLGVTGFLALRSPWVLVAGPTLLWRFVGDNPYYWGIEWHYSLVLMPIVFCAMIDAVVRLRSGDGPDWLRTYASQVPAVATAVALVMCLQLPVKALFDPATWQESPRAASARAALDAIPPGSSVETDIGLITHLTSDRTVYWTGTVGDAVPDYVLVDTLGGGWSQQPDVVAYAEQQHPGTRYEQVLDDGGFLVARRLPS
ncbi:DUF2079 domain-containing protein [Solicola sp. PLA-1-18]|uniref:DUF2079 domain-containing protein n=1 Tax=Solicola sp. PLA-1-18 TaxID=3380532 RepID=UPI003B81166D